MKKQVNSEKAGDKNGQQKSPFLHQFLFSIRFSNYLGARHRLLILRKQGKPERGLSLGGLITRRIFGLTGRWAYKRGGGGGGVISGSLHLR